jgi:hypothetical protein
MADASLNKKAEKTKAWLEATRPAAALDPAFPYEDSAVIVYICQSPKPFDPGKANQGWFGKFRARISLSRKS